jgi:Phosphopantetheine attachment site
VTRRPWRLVWARRCWHGSPPAGVSLILRRSVDPDRPLSEYGVDSLGAVELRTRIETEPEYASLPPTSPPFAVWRDCCAKNWPPPKPSDVDVSA